MIDPRQARIDVYTASDEIAVCGRGEVLTDEALLPGFRLDLDAFFGPAEEPPAPPSD